MTDDTNRTTSVRLKERVPVLPHTVTYKNNNCRFGDHINQSTYQHLYFTVTKYMMFSGGQRQTDRLPHLIMKYQPCGKRSQGRPLKRFLGCWWDQNRSRGLKPYNLYIDDDDDDDDVVTKLMLGVFQIISINAPFRTVCVMQQFSLSLHRAFFSLFN